MLIIVYYLLIQIYIYIMFRSKNFAELQCNFLFILILPLNFKNIALNTAQI